MQINEISRLIQSRRAYTPKFFSDLPIDPAWIEKMLENANWAPTHKRTEPWRFRIFHSSQARQRLSDFIAEDYTRQTPAEMYSEVKMRDMADKPLASGCTIALCMQRDPAQSLPEWEEIAAVACAVQNLWLSCTAMGLGGYWATPGFITRLGPVLELAEGEKCLGLFYMGHLKPGTELPATRKPVAEKIRWMK